MQVYAKNCVTSARQWRKLGPATKGQWELGLCVAAIDVTSSKCTIMYETMGLLTAILFHPVELAIT